MSGGFKYNPTTSHSFSTKCLSRLSLNVLVRCGCRRCRRQIRRTVASLRPWAAAIVRVLQWVAATGVVYSVASITAWICASEMRGSRPGRGASFSRPPTRRARNRSRHNWTVGRETPKRSAISLLETP